ncbi:MAG: hypothetical protein V2G42_01930 [bacterium JZ-2024 1]
MKWLPAVAMAIILVALLAIAQMFFAIRDLEKREKDLYAQVNSLGAEYDKLQSDLFRLVKLPKPQLVTSAQAEMDFAKFVDELRKAGVAVAEISPPKKVEQKEATLATDIEDEEPSAPFQEVVGTVKIGETGPFDRILELLSSLQQNPRLLRLSTIEAKAGYDAGQYVITIEAVYAVASEGGG